jgi:hypothetical protein
MGLEGANSGRRAIRNNRAQIGGLDTKPARLRWTRLRTRRAQRFEEDNFRCSFSNDSAPSTTLDARWGPAPHTKNSDGAPDRCNWSNCAVLLAPAAAAAFSKLLAPSWTIPFLENAYDGHARRRSRGGRETGMTPARTKWTRCSSF